MVLLIDKPVGVTSFDVIRKLRKELGIRKMGHAGTLDPLASGLLIIATDEDTKKLDQFLKLPKTYEVSVRLGERRDTGDLEGKIIEEKEFVGIENIEEVTNNFIGVHVLSVPMYSAIKVSGKPLYWYARNNKEVAVPEKEMEVRTIKLLGISNNEVRLLLDVSSGTYIRSLAEEFGRRLGYPATVSFLRRVSIGEYSVEDAKKITAD